MGDSIIADRLRSKESVFFNHSVKKASSKVVAALQAPTPASCASGSGELDLYSLEIDKAELVATSCAQQLEDYRSLEAKVKGVIESTRSEIATLSGELRVAKKVRQHKEQYEALAKKVNAHAPKPTTMAEQRELEEELRKLGYDKARLDEQVSC